MLLDSIQNVHNATTQYTRERNSFSLEIGKRFVIFVEIEWQHWLQSKYTDMALTDFFTLPRNKVLEMNAFEFGYLTAAISSENLDKMKEDCPIMWPQFQILFAESYTDGHALSEQAKKDVAKYKKQLRKLLKERKDQVSWL